MNENARKLYEDLKESRLPEFHMGAVESCGTPQCILGHALYRIGMLREFSEWSRAVRDGKTSHCAVSDSPWARQAFQFLGLRVSIAKDLCFPTGDGPWRDILDPFDASQPQAAEALKRACEMSGD